MLQQRDTLVFPHAFSICKAATTYSSASAYADIHSGSSHLVDCYVYSVLHLLVYILYVNLTSMDSVTVHINLDSDDSSTMTSQFIKQISHLTLEISDPLLVFPVDSHVNYNMQAFGLRDYFTNLVYITCSDIPMPCWQKKDVMLQLH